LFLAKDKVNNTQSILKTAVGVGTSH